MKTEEESAASIFAIFVACILLVVVCVFGYIKPMGQSSREKTEMIEAAHIEDEASKTPMMEEVDSEGVMEEVELL